MRTYAHADQESKYWGDYVDEEVYETEVPVEITVSIKGIDPLNPLPKKTPRLSVNPMVNPWYVENNGVQGLLPEKRTLDYKKKSPLPPSVLLRNEQEKIPEIPNPYSKKTFFTPNQGGGFAGVVSKPRVFTNPYLDRKQSYTVFIGENMMVNRPPEGQNSSSPAVGMLFTSEGSKLYNFYSTVIRDGIKEGLTDLSEGDHMFGVLKNFRPHPILWKESNDNYVRGNFSVGIMYFKQKVGFDDFYPDGTEMNFDLEAPGPGEFVGMYKVFLPVKDFGIAFSAGGGFGFVLTAPRIKNYMGIKGNGYNDGYKFHGRAISGLTRLDMSYKRAFLFLSVTYTQYIYDPFYLPTLGVKNVENYGILGVVTGAGMTLQSNKKKVKPDEY